MHHQVAEDGGASATDGYSPAGEAPPPPTGLLNLPPALLDDIACRLGRQCCDQLLTPRVVAALQARTCKLALTLWQPETEDSMYYSKQLAPTLQLPQTEYTQDYTDLLAHALAKLDKCAAVELKQLSIAAVLPKKPGLPPLPSFQPLAPHLTQLHFVSCVVYAGLSFFIKSLQPQAQLQRLELTGRMDWKAITHLPLHSLSQPPVLNDLYIGVKDISDPVVAAAIHRLAYACKVPQQRVDLAQLVALLQPLQRCFVDKVVVFKLHDFTAADVLALAPLCRDCNHFALGCGTMEPSLEFWHQLVQLMPAVQEVDFLYTKGCVSAAMHESLQLMAEQPWARWLHVTIRNSYSVDQPPACWQAGSWLETGIIKESEPPRILWAYPTDSLSQCW
ncbi:hypothetical protein HaLaN_30795, partial [Haematococcus lacustris]